MESILENRYIFYVVLFICFLNLMADVAAREFLFVFLFLGMIFILDFFITNKTLLLFISFMISNVLLLKFKYNQMKYYYLYLQSSDKKSKIPSYV
jgi:hypothetical protein